MVNICECDVNDKESLALYRLKREEWKRCLIDDDHSVFQQIHHLVWNDIVFRTFNEARRLSVVSKDDDIGFNGPLINLIDEGFVASQVMSIRRLTDPNFYDPQKAIISLKRIIDDIADSLDLITRENYICFDGTKFEGLTHENDGMNWMHWKRKNKNFDRLSGVSNSNRSRNDKMDRKIISSLRSEMGKCQNLRTYANKFIAHTSDQAGKAKLTDEQKGITLNHLDEAYRAIIKSGAFLGAIFLYESSLGGVPTPQYDKLKNLDKPMVKTSDLSSLSAFWFDRAKKVGEWEQDLWP